MPYRDLKSLPSAVKVLPLHAQKIWMSTFNSAFNELGETRAFKIAWASVKRKFKKEKGKWEKKSLDVKNDEAKAGYVPKMGLEHEHVIGNPNILSRGRIVDSRKEMIYHNGGDTAALWAKHKMNKAHPDFDSTKRSIEDGFIDHFSMEFVKEEFKFVESPVGRIRVLDKFNLTGDTLTGKPVHDLCKITNFYSDSSDDFFVEGYIVASDLDKYNDFVTENAINHANEQIQSALSVKSDDIDFIHLKIEEEDDEEEEFEEPREEKMIQNNTTEGINMKEEIKDETKPEETPTEPAPVEPVPVEPAPAEPAPAEPAPAEPAPAEPEGEKPKEEAKSVSIDEIKSLIKEELKSLKPEKKNLVEQNEKFEKKKDEFKSIADAVTKRQFGKVE